jgi:hypothetical protein
MICYLENEGLEELKDLGKADVFYLVRRIYKLKDAAEYLQITTEKLEKFTKAELLTFYIFDGFDDCEMVYFEDDLFNFARQYLEEDTFKKIFIRKVERVALNFKKYKKNVLKWCGGCLSKPNQQGDL